MNIEKNKEKINNRSRYVKLVNMMLIAALALVFLSGILLHPLQGAAAIKILHKISSLAFVLAVVVHILQHRK
ncbi:MAG: hypothetical protein ACI4EJ_08280 [Bacteroides sp.]